MKERRQPRGYGHLAKNGKTSKKEADRNTYDTATDRALLELAEILAEIARSVPDADQIDPEPKEIQE
jgi:hypothetical protein